MKRSEAIAALSKVMDGPDLDALASGLERDGAILTDEWGASECAMLALRTLAPMLSHDRFLVEIAWAPLVGITVTDKSGIWRVRADSAWETPYMEHSGDTPLDGLALHLSRLAGGWAAEPSYPVFVELAIAERENALRLYMGFLSGRQFGVGYTLAYGDPVGWQQSFPLTNNGYLGGDAVWELVRELRRDLAPKREQTRGARYALNADSVAIESMLRGQFADKTVTVH